MVQLGEGFTAALERSDEPDRERSIGAIVEECCRRLRADLLVEIRAEVERVANPMVVDALVQAIGGLPTPVVNIAAAEVTVPPSPAPMVVVERPKELRVVRDKDGKITGVKPA